MIDKIVQKLKDAKQKRSDFVDLMDSFNDPYLVFDWLYTKSKNK